MIPPRRKITFIALATPLAALVAGCAMTGATNGGRVDYECTNDKPLAVTYAPDRTSAVVEIGRNRFTLLSEPAADTDERYRCDVLTLRRRGEIVAIDLQESAYLESCRPVR